MEYIYFCPECKATFRYEGQASHLCPDCQCVTVFSGYNASDWYAKPHRDRESIKIEVIKTGAVNRDVGDAAILDKFKATDTIRFKTGSSDNDFISYDKNTSLVNINGRYLLKDRIFGFDLVEDGEQVTKGGLGAAVAGGLVGSLAPRLIGRSTGAIVGASIGKRKTTNNCISLDVIITLNDPNTHELTENIVLHLISSPVSKQSVDYMQAKLSGQKIIEFLTKITEESSSKETHSIETQQSISSVNEILEFKKLLDAGIITQEEFDAKKKQLLRL